MKYGNVYQSTLQSDWHTGRIQEIYVQPKKGKYTKILSMSPPVPVWWLRMAVHILITSSKIQIK